MELKYSRTIPVKRTVDVFVAGGGPSGIAAAIAAARMGAAVFLAENLGAFGGMGTSGGIPFICRPTDGVNFLAGGIGREVYDRVFQAGGAAPEMVYDRHPDSIGGFVYNPESLKRVYDDMMTECGADFTFSTRVIDVQKQEGFVTHAICAAPSGVFAVAAKIFVDATGDGDLAAKAGAPFEFGDRDGLAQASTLCSLWSGIDWSRKRIWTDHLAVRKAFEEGVFEIPDPGLPGILHTRADSGWGNVGHLFGIDSRDECSLTSGNPAAFWAIISLPSMISAARLFSKMRSVVMPIRLICMQRGHSTAGRKEVKAIQYLSVSLITNQEKIMAYPTGFFSPARLKMYWSRDAV